jgi:hypothetical protein
VDLAGHDPEWLAVEEEIVLAEPEIADLPGEPGKDGKDDQGGDRPADSVHATLLDFLFHGTGGFYHRSGTPSRVPGWPETAGAPPELLWRGL